MLDLVATTSPVFRQLLPAGATVVIATSGGPDSQCLLDLICRARHQLGLGRVFAAGVDHGLRPEAPSELSLAGQLALQHGVSFRRLSVEVAKEGNLLAAARRARYGALRAFAREVGATRLVTAHTADDQAETVLLNLARGSGLPGAAGMRWRRGILVRPLLGTRRPDILAYLRERQIVFATDPSNSDPRRARAKLRQAVLPALTAVHPAAVESLVRFAAHARRDERALTRAARALLAERRGPHGSLRLLPLPPPALAGRLVRLWLAEHGLAASAAVTRRLLKDGRPFDLDRHIIERSSGLLWLHQEQPDAGTPIPLGVPGRAYWKGADVWLSSHLLPAPQDPPAWARALEPARVAFDADRIHLDLRVRTFRAGDRLAAYGLGGSIKVSDLYTNMKLPKPFRRGWPLICAGDELAWVVGLRRGSLAPVTPESRRLLVLQVEGALPWSAC